MRVHWSIHDVAPDTLGAVAELLARLAAAGATRVTLLVIPGHAWTAEHLEILRQWQTDGHDLAAHGWAHRASDRRDMWHKFHALVLSRDAAEHLSRSAVDIRKLIEASLQWFAAARLAPPTFYVPPAWAMGSLAPSALADTSLRHVETLSGLVDIRNDALHLLPLVGFEADTALRAVLLRLANAANRLVARATGRPLRIAIHPHDAQLRLAADLEWWIRQGCTGVPTAELVPGTMA